MCLYFSLPILVSISQNFPDGTRNGLKATVVDSVQSHFELLRDPSNQCAPTDFSALQVICKNAEVFIEHAAFEECVLACGEELRKVNSNRLAAEVQESLDKLTTDGKIDLEEVKKLIGILQNRTDKIERSEKMGEGLLKQVGGIDAPELGHYLGFKTWLPEWQRLVPLLKPILLKADGDKLANLSAFWKSMCDLAAVSAKYDHASALAADVPDFEGDGDGQGAETSKSDERLQCLQELNRMCKLATAAHKACIKSYGGKAERTPMDDQLENIITELHKTASKEGLEMIKERRECNKAIVESLQNIQGGSKNGPEDWWTGCPAEEMGWEAFCTFFKENSCPEENLKSTLDLCQGLYEKECNFAASFGKLAAWQSMEAAICKAKSSLSSLKLMNCYLDGSKSKADSYKLTKDEIAFLRAAGKTAQELGWPEYLKKAMKSAMKMSGTPT